MTDLSNIKLFATHEHPCSYLEGETATTVFVDPAAEIDNHVYSELSRYGFRRSGKHIYRPRCSNCHACIPIRTHAHAFKQTRSQKRCWRRNQDMAIRVVQNINTDEHYSLYADYIGKKHADGDMYPPSRSQYEDFLCEGWGSTLYIEGRVGGKLIMVAVSDKLENGLSAIYTYYDTFESKRSLGVYSILYQLNLAKKMELQYLYLGYWIKRCQKMSYKNHYRPFDVLINNRWVCVY